MEKSHNKNMDHDKKILHLEYKDIQDLPVGIGIVDHVEELKSETQTAVETLPVIDTDPEFNSQFVKYDAVTNFVVTHS